MNEQMMEFLKAQEANGNENKAKLFQKLVNVLKAVESVPKNGYNKFQDYHYATEADVMGVIREQLIKQGLFIFTSSNVKDVKELNKDGKVSLITSVVTEHVIVDAETGATHTVFGAGQGHDSLDKGVFKAITGANKYFLQKTFMISGEDDPESDGVSAPKPSAPASGRTFNRPAATTASSTTTAPAKAPAKTPAPSNGKAASAPTGQATVTPIKQATAAPTTGTTTTVRRTFSRAPVQAAPVAQAVEETEPAEVGTNAEEAAASDELVRF